MKGGIGRCVAYHSFPPALNHVGNLHVNPACGLLFVDWLSGDVLQLTGHAEVAHHDRSMPGAQRSVRFRLASWHWAPAALPILPAPVLDRSPYNPLLHPASEELTIKDVVDSSNSSNISDATAHRMVECVGVVDEADGIRSFFFAAPPGLKYAAGQYASFELNIPAGTPAAGSGSGGSVTSQTITRTWTISSHPAETAASGAFSISVKKIGLASGWLHTSLQPGGVVCLRGVGGEFLAQGDAEGAARPALLLAGGIGGLRAGWGTLIV
jgi:hypothetical protein